MNKNVLFQVTDEDLETGLRGIPVGYCPTSTVDPQKGLFYMGFPIPEVANWEPEEVIFLLYKGKRGDKKEIAEFKQDLQKRALCPRSVIKHIEALPKQGHPMALFSAAILLLGMFELTGDYREDCLNLIAKIPEVAATVINHHAGKGPTPPSRPELGYTENFSQMLNITEKTAELTNVLKLFNILHYDHGGGNLSTFVGKATASGLEDLYGSICAAMNALAGPRHGRANQECLVFVEKILRELRAKATETDVEKFIRQMVDRKELVYGFGHAVLRVEDPRATLFYELAEKKYSDNPIVKMALLIRKSGSRVLKENPKITDPYPNVDAISGVVLTAAGFSNPAYYTLLFGLSRIVGISIQIVYERCEARGGKGTPIVRPKYIFKPR